MAWFNKEEKANSGNTVHNKAADCEEDDDIDPVEEIIKLRQDVVDIAKALVEMDKKLNVIITSSGYVIDSMKSDIAELKSALGNNNDFMQSVVMKLIEKPVAAPAPAASAKSALERYNENKAAAAKTDTAAGPKGKLP